VFLEEARLGNVLLELSLGRGGFATVELFSGREFEQLTLALDDGVVLLEDGLVAVGAVDSRVGQDSRQDCRADAH